MDWITEDAPSKEYKVDWKISPIGTETILSMPESQYVSISLALTWFQMCRSTGSIVFRRKGIKKEMKRQCQPQEVMGLFEWTLKLAADYLYLSLPLYI